VNCHGPGEEDGAATSYSAGSSWRRMSFWERPWLGVSEETGSHLERGSVW
jgi:hypothetical protein